MTEGPKPGALAGVKVLDLSRVLAGPWATQILGDLGAEVLKIEPPGGDSTRRAGPFPGDIPHSEASGLFLHLNTGKRSITLDVTTATGRQMLGDLIEGADVLIHDLNATGAAALDLAGDSLAAAYPRLVVAAITWFGSTGPYAGYAGEEIVADALSGYLSITGDPDREPLKPYGSQAQYQAGLHAAVAVCAAVYAAEDSGQGELIDASIMEAVEFVLGGPPALANLYGTVVKRNGTRLIGLGPAQPYPSTLRPCHDGWVHAHSNNRHRDLLAALTGETWLAEPEVLAAMTARADDIDSALDRWLADKTKWEAVGQAQQIRLPFTEVLTPTEVLADRHGHLAAYGSMVTLDHPVAGAVQQPGAPVRLGRTPWSMSRAPLLGEHNEGVYCDSLGVSKEELVRLRQAGVI